MGSINTFSCSKCVLFSLTITPHLKVRMSHPALADQLEPVQSLYEDVKKKALMRLEYEGLSKCEAVSTEGARWYNDPAGNRLSSYFHFYT